MQHNGFSEAEFVRTLASFIGFRGEELNARSLTNKDGEPLQEWFDDAEAALCDLADELEARL